MQKRGMFFLLLICLSLFLFQTWQNTRAVQPPFEKMPLLLQPLTLQEKILLNIPLSMNQLTVEEWSALPHISSKVAQRIVEYRRQHGRFENMEELLNVSGVGIKTLEFVKPFLKNPPSM